MRSCQKPSYNFSEIYDICSSSRVEPIRSQLRLVKEKIEESNGIYEQKMRDAKPFEITTIDENSILPIKHKDLENLYNDKLVKGAARYIYDEILVKAKSKGCCFCTHEEPIELDHYLAKTKFAEFSVNPLNLIPSCHRCNKAKSDYSPSNLENSFIHPYFEDMADTLLWLNAKMIYQDNCPVIKYEISEDLDPTQNSRLQFQFYKLRLNERYSRQAAREISNREYRFRNIFEERGPEGVREDLELECEGYFSKNQNSWQAALYSCLKNDEYFHSMLWNIL